MHPWGEESLSSTKEAVKCKPRELTRGLGTFPFQFIEAKWRHRSGSCRRHSWYLVIGPLGWVLGSRTLEMGFVNGREFFIPRY